MTELTPQEIVASLPEDLRPIAEETFKRRYINVSNINALETAGVSMDFSVARVEFLIDSLMGLGVISERQKWEMSLDWERHLHAQLKAAHKAASEAMARQRLWKPGG